MTVLALIILVIASIFAAYFGKSLPAPWPIVVYGILVLLWILVFVFVSGLGGGFLNQRLADLQVAPVAHACETPDC